MALKAKTLLTLQALFGTIVSTGALDLSGATGIVVLDHLTRTTSASNDLVIDADSDRASDSGSGDPDDDGTLTLHHLARTACFAQVFAQAARCGQEGGDQGGGGERAN